MATKLGFLSSSRGKARTRNASDELAYKRELSERASVLVSSSLKKRRHF